LQQADTWNADRFWQLYIRRPQGSWALLIEPFVSFTEDAQI
jgi:hypothetical protein